jgi:hypothetical protein
MVVQDRTATGRRCLSADVSRESLERDYISFTSERQDALRNEEEVVRLKML